MKVSTGNGPDFDVKIGWVCKIFKDDRWYDQGLVDNLIDKQPRPKENSKEYKFRNPTFARSLQGYKLGFAHHSKEST